MDIGITGHGGFLGKCVFDRLKGNKKVSSVEGFGHPEQDILDRASVERFVSGKDVIIHLAALNRADEMDIMKVNLLGTLSLVKAIKEKNPACRLLFSSSFQVYSNSTEKDTIDEDFPVGPLTAYGLSKRFGEELALSQLDGCAVFRISNIYGPGCRPFYNSVVATFLHLAKEGKEISINGSGSQLRDFVFVDDVARAFELAVFSKVSGIFNICTGEAISMNTVAELIKREFPKLKIAHKAAEEGSFSTRGSYEMAKKAFKWVPKTRFEDGLKKCL
jgi:UDP-glucose 4-epimerase